LSKQFIQRARKR